MLSLLYHEHFQFSHKAYTQNDQYNRFNALRSNFARHCVPVLDHDADCNLHPSRGKRAGEPSESKWSPQPMEALSLRRVASALFASWKGTGYLIVEDRDDGEGEGGVDHRNSHSLDEKKQQKLFTSVMCESVGGEVYADDHFRLCDNAFGTDGLRMDEMETDERVQAVEVNRSKFLLRFRLCPFKRRRLLYMQPRRMHLRTHYGAMHADRVRLRKRAYDKWACRSQSLLSVIPLQFKKSLYIVLTAGHEKIQYLNYVRRGQGGGFSVLTAPPPGGSARARLGYEINLSIVQPVRTLSLRSLMIYRPPNV
ncbi:hypothetical protein EVAR_12519_1 [Eumeta japonica]|uniref:Uncharacterized protein n=1 Tax=Eumeta variegata TaxID=151549 RepID=A0A4C1TPP1_EUMVA|nr:hypothetical protein EVAR_12519_1 [Eumeta japonica]